MTQNQKIFLAIFAGIVVVGSIASIIAVKSGFIAFRYSDSEAASNVQRFDVVIVGGSEGGVAAAVQAKKAGRSVALIEETNWLGGMSTAAGVSTMDTTTPAVNTGFYKTFTQAIRSHYARLQKSIATSWTTDVAFEPSVGNSIFGTLLSSSTGTGSIRTYYGRKITNVTKNGTTVTNVTTNRGEVFAAKVFIDATDNGDVVALSGAKYRAGNSTSDSLNPQACIQDITYTANIKKYPNGIPAALRINDPPPGYNTDTMYCSIGTPGTIPVRECFARYVVFPGDDWIGPGRYPASFANHNAYRGTPNRSEPGSYDATAANYRRISKTGVNWANDYPNTVADLSTTRATSTCSAKMRTIQFLYYVQNELGQPWSVADDEYNSSANSCATIPLALKEIEKRMPLMPYVRESRRIVGTQTLTGQTLSTSPQNHRDSIALGGYWMDLHQCDSQASLESWSGDTTDMLMRDSGTVQVPMGVLIPETINGLIVGNGKLISTSRIANGALRHQPINMLIGQAAGALAAEAAKTNTQPRDVPYRSVQKNLLQSGDALVYFSDMPETHRYFSSMQLSALDGYMIGYGNNRFGTADPLKRRYLAIVISRMLNLPLEPAPTTPTFVDVPTTDPEFRQIELLYQTEITKGCSTSPMKFCPEDNVKKEQLAAFMMRTWKLIDPSKELISPALASYSDVPTSHPFFKEIESLRHYGIDISCQANPLKYCPGELATRAEIAHALAIIMKL